MAGLHIARALTPDGWVGNARIEIKDGLIARLTADCSPEPDDERHWIALPGMPNLHSHAFQRGMAGLAEHRGPMPDSFWTWRDTMYRFALTMTPEHVEAVAAQLYVEMLEAGFTRVGEFHYLHHDRDGRPYGELAEMANRIVAAAAETGIGLTLLPVFYAHGNFGGAPPAAGQRRFLSDLDTYSQLLETSGKAVAALADGLVGVAPHSLRAVTPEQLSAVIAMAGERPIHIHVGEQMKEVEDCLAWSGERPVAWLLGHASVGSNWCLIHATHMTEGETRAMAGTGAVAGLCPITEANLGDGVFNGPLFAACGGRYGIGSDSNIRIGVAEELRQLEYAQRLRDRARNLMAAGSGSTGRALFAAAVAGGSAALGVAAAGIRAQAAADIVTLRAEHPVLAGRDGDAILDAWVFAGGNELVDCVWRHGTKLVDGGRHIKRERIGRRYAAAMQRLNQ